MKKKIDLWVYSHPTLKKLIMELKIAILLVVISVSNVLAIPTYSQVAKVSLDMKNTSLEQVMDEIETQSEFYFVFNQKQIDVNRVVDIKAENKLITDILPGLFKGTDVNYIVFDRKILLTTDPIENDLLTISSGTKPQQKQITGKVTDETGSPLPGVNIQIEGTITGAISDARGNYSIVIPNDNAVLIFSFIGYTIQKVPASGKTTIDVALALTVSSLEDVVVVGYRTVTRGTITGSVSMINSAELQNTPANNLSNMMAGRLSGVVVQQVAGTPGQESNIMIRTSGTLNNSSPLYVIDGIVSTKFAFDAMGSDEVASISILKDAASAAVYGSRGANGVILVTTKRGSNKAPVINYTGSFGVQTPTRIPPALNAYEQALLINDGLAYQKYYAQDFVVDPNDPILYTQDELDYFKNTSYNWIEELWRDPITT